MTTAAGNYYYGLGRRKTAIARVRLYPGNGQITVNGKPAEELFQRPEQRRLIEEPLRHTGMQNSFSAMVRCTGGGTNGWAGAIRLGIARALLASDETLRRPLRQAGMLTRDPRAKERKKPGLKRARKAPQYTKR
ncbi:MAG: 30S ribosomal protein S9 [Chloroflexi bacterium]|nr:30S ribosomal protein S9 [Chloroflexota bacterium]MCY3696522.1 30S ribosomal protein S9 [Chloroflexota bacterium]MXX31372.1 30S ribosomal protein S9 [Chloroflexota bacterium]MXX80200.1 30S ribosomal protein S9 [Chloroflexota bacterium]MYB21254.1 30S ribosomal protein S9 [Chloroflexota bacterium]